MREIDEVEQDLASVWASLEALLGRQVPAFEAELLLLLRDLHDDATRPAAKEVRALILQYAAAAPAPDGVSLLLDSTRTLGEAGAPEPEDVPTDDGFEGEAVPVEKFSPRHVVVPVWYATDRNHRSDEDPSHRYGIDRAEARADGSLLDYGLASVSIPDGHRKGHLESPKWYKLEFRENPDKHIVVLDADELDRAAWFGSIQDAAAIAGNTDTSNDILVFVHGYKTSWADAIKRAAQLSYDLEFDGRTVAYTWPSQGKFVAYTVDEANAAWSAPHFTEFLRDLLAHSGAKRVHLVAHSMGNRLTTPAIRDLARPGTPVYPTLLGKVVFAAPDVDADTFRELVTAFHTDTATIDEALRPHLTLYSCSLDAALDVSSAIRGGMSRAGLTRDDKVVVVAPMETIEVSKIVIEDDDDDRIGHAYFCSNRAVIGDMNRLVLLGQRAGAPRFGLKSVGGGTYWEL